MKQLYSKILSFFSPELMVELKRITYLDASNTEKGKMVESLLRSSDNESTKNFMPLGSGTNRLGLQIEDTVFKIALDRHGGIDNRREYRYTDKLQPYVIKVYECLEDGLIIACEPFIPMTEADFVENHNEIIRILKNISRNFFIGDIGYNKDNYANWGFRKTDKGVGILDFAYIYTVNYNIFRCPKCGSFLHYDDNYVDLVCDQCDEKFPFNFIRKRISKKAEMDEIGNITDSSYVIHSTHESVVENPDYTISLYNDEIKKREVRDLKKESKERNRRIIREMNRREHSTLIEKEADSPMSFNELMEKLSNKISAEEKEES